MEERMEKVLAGAGAALRAGEWREAERLCGQVLVIEPGCGLAVQLQGLAVLRGGRVAEAVALLRRSVESDRMRPGWWFNLGVACHGAGRVAEAAEALRATLRLQPYHVGALFRLGRCLREMGLMHEACAAFAQVLRLSPDHAEARAGLAGVTEALREAA